MAGLTILPRPAVYSRARTFNRRGNKLGHRRAFRPLALHLRKRVAQVGVILLVASYLAAIVPVIWNTAFPYFFTISSGLVLFVAALLPEPPDETWGCIWPLAGYDNVIDALYVRGPWQQRFYELDEQEARNRVTTAMGQWF